MQKLQSYIQSWSTHALVMQCFLLTGNLLAVGTMEPYINIWDLDVMDTIDPVLTLGERKKKKSKKVWKHGSVGVDLPLEYAEI